MHYQSVIFDFDYTLGDDTDTIYAGFLSAMEELGHPLPHREAVRHTVGLTLEEGYTRLSGDTSPEGRDKFRQLFIAVATQQQREHITPLCSGAQALLVALGQAGVTMALVSTKDTFRLGAILKQHGLESTMALIVGGDKVSQPKPDPEGLNLAIATLGLDRGTVLYCGDTIIDAKTAQGAGVDFCAVLNGTTPAGAFLDFPHLHIAPNLHDLQRWLNL